MSAIAINNATVEDKLLGSIKSFENSGSYYSIRYTTGENARLSFLNDHVFRFQVSLSEKFTEYPTHPSNAEISAKICVKPIKQHNVINSLEQGKDNYIVDTNVLRIYFDKLKGTLEVFDKRTNNIALKEYKPIQYNDSEFKQTLYKHDDEYLYGGGMLTCSYTHNGTKLPIEHNSDGVQACPKPFYWSTKGYGILRNTWASGVYNFSLKQYIQTVHNDDHFDAFFFISAAPKDILNDYYELSGRPILMPEYAFYEAHINTFNNIYWYECGMGELNEIHVGETDRTYNPTRNATVNGESCILGSLNGENPFYDFSARAMIDWYKMQDMPLGWFIPNNESGYGQTDTFAGDLENLKKFVEYAHENGVEVGLWLDKTLEPKERKNPQKEERDIEQELNVGVVALKSESAWTIDDFIYSFDPLENAYNIFSKTMTNVRPFMITVDGWAGVQRYAGVWSGAYTGGMWEYIRNHIPTYIGAGLSGLPVVGSDMDGAYGGGDIEVYIRDFQWKTFTPLQLNADGWGRAMKVPFSYNCLEALNLTRAYLKMKSMLMPYNYTISYECLQGLPMMRAMFLEFPDEVASFSKDSEYQFMWGPSLLIAPVYSNKDVNRRPKYVNSGSFYWVDHEFEYIKQNPEDEAVRNGIFLPDEKQVWIDLFTGDKYQGGKIYNNFKSPIWKIPVFVKDGAIIPIVNANNNPNEIKRDCRIFLLFPNGKTDFEVYEDDGKSSDYIDEKFAKTKISVIGPTSNKKGTVSICINKTTGCYQNMTQTRKTFLQIMVTKKVKTVRVTANNNTIKMRRVRDKEKFDNSDNVYYCDYKFMLNSYLKGFDTNDMLQTFLCIKIQETDVTETEIIVEIEGYSNKGSVFGGKNTTIDNLVTPHFQTPTNNEVTATTITLNWELVNASYYEIERDGNIIFSNILENRFTFKDFDYNSKHAFKIRSANKLGVSDWSSTLLIETKGDPYKDIIDDIEVSCDKQSEFQLDVSNLIKVDRSWWHTEWNYYCVWNYTDENKMDEITLSFDLKKVYKIHRIAYIPREDAGNGTFLKVQYQYSLDGDTWSDKSEVVSWDHDDSTKIIDMNRSELRYFKLVVIDSVMGFGSGRNILFYEFIEEPSSMLSMLTNCNVM